MPQARFVGPYPVHHMYRPAIDQPGEVWEVNPGDVLDLPEVPDHPWWEAVKPAKAKGADQ